MTDPAAPQGETAATPPHDLEPSEPDPQAVEGDVAQAATPEKPSRRLLRLGLGVVTLALALRGIFSLLPATVEHPQVVAIPPPKVRLLTLQAESLSRAQERYARLVPVQQWVLSLEVGGRLEARPASNGLACAEGTLLLGLDPGPFEATRDAARADVEQAQTQLTLSEADLARAEQLRTTTTTKQNVDQATTARDRAQAALAAAQARLRLAQYSLDHSRLVAPARGVVSNLGVEEGDVVAPGQPLGCFSRIDQLLVKLLVSWEVRRGIEVGAEAKVVDGREKVHPAVLARAAPVQSGETGQFELEFLVDNADGGLLAGEPVRCRFFTGADELRLRIPRASAYEEYGLWRALVPGQDGVEPERPFVAGSVSIVPGTSDPQQGWLEVLQGLSPGSRVLVPERVAVVREGQRVVAVSNGLAEWLPPYAQGR